MIMLVIYIHLTNQPRETPPLFLKIIYFIYLNQTGNDKPYIPFHIYINYENGNNSSDYYKNRAQPFTNAE